MSLPDLASDHAEHEADNENRREPPLRRLAILSHHLEMHIGFLGGGTACAGPNVPSVEEENVGDCRHEGGKRHSVRERERRPQHQRRVLLVRSLVEREVGIQNAARVVGRSEMVKVGILRDGQISVEFGACICQPNRAEHHNEDAGTDVEDGKGGRLQGGKQESADGGPVKGDGDQPNACLPTKQLVDKNIVGRNKAGKSKDLQELGNDLREPLVAKRASGNDYEELVPPNLPAVCERWVGC